MSASLRGKRDWKTFQQTHYWAKGISKDSLKLALETNLHIYNDGPKLVNSIPSDILPLLVGVDRCTEAQVCHGIVLEAGSSIKLQKPTLKQSTTEVGPSPIAQEHCTSHTVASSDDCATLDYNVDRDIYPGHVTDPSSAMHSERVDSLYYSVSSNTQNTGVRDASVSQMVEQEFTRSHYQGIQTTVPTARWVLKNQSLNLSEPVIAELKRLQANLLEHCDDEKDMQVCCLNYFQKYGTHVNLGEVHFGGKYTWEGRYKGVEEDIQFVKTLVGSYLAEYISNAPREIAQTENLEVQTLHDGGLQDAPSFELWKIGLLANSKSWVVIQQSINYVGIWDILKYHTDVLQDVTSLCEKLKDAWLQLASNDRTADSVTNHGIGANQETKQGSIQREQTNRDMGKVLPSIPYMSEKQQIHQDMGQRRQTSPDLGQMQQTIPYMGQKQKTKPYPGQREQTDSYLGERQQTHPYLGQRQQTDSYLGQRDQIDQYRGHRQQIQLDMDQNQQSDSYMGERQEIDPYIDLRQLSNPNMGQRQEIYLDLGEAGKSELYMDKRHQTYPDISVRQESHSAMGQRQHSYQYIGKREQACEYMCQRKETKPVISQRHQTESSGKEKELANPYVEEGTKANRASSQRLQTLIDASQTQQIYTYMGERQQFNPYTGQRQKTNKDMGQKQHITPYMGESQEGDSYMDQRQPTEPAKPYMEERHQTNPNSGQSQDNNLNIDKLLEYYEDMGQGQKSHPCMERGNEQVNMWVKNKKQTCSWVKNIKTTEDMGQPKQSKPCMGKTDQIIPYVDQAQQIDMGQRHQIIPCMGQIQQINQYIRKTEQTSKHMSEHMDQRQQTSHDMGSTKQTTPDIEHTQEINLRIVHPFQQSRQGMLHSHEIDQYIGPTLQINPSIDQTQQTHSDNVSRQENSPDMGATKKSCHPYPELGEKINNELERGEQRISYLKMRHQNTPTKLKICALDIGNGDKTNLINQEDDPLTQKVEHTEIGDDDIRISYDEISSSLNIYPTQISSDKKANILQYLSLENYYPEKISVGDVMAIVNELRDQPAMANVPWDILRKLIMLDHRAYSSEVTKCKRSDKESQEATDSDCDEFDDLESLVENCDELNPQDVFLTIFSCCDLNLRQILLEKMYMCRLALPVLSPNIFDQSLTYNLWALRSTILSWRDKEGKAKEGSAMGLPIHVASCIRLKRPNSSKSKLLNDVISDQHHHTFYNVDCPNGNVKRVVAEGLVEGSYFLPSGKKTDILKDVTMFLNLRGDGIELERQVDTLCELSNVMVVCVDISDINHPDSIATMRRIHRTSKNVIIIFSDLKCLATKVVKQKLQEYKKNIGDIAPVPIKKVFAFQSKTASQVRDDTRQAIANVLDGNEGKIMQDSSDILLSKGLWIDEMSKSCQEGKKLANEAILCLNQSKSKTKVLTIQGKHWKEWCTLLKSTKRSQHMGLSDPNKVLHEIGRIQDQMNCHRKEQEILCNHLSAFMCSFIDSLNKIVDTPTVDYYLKWLKMFLDEASREELTPLRETYNQKLRIYKDLKKKSLYTKAIQSEIKEIQVNLENVGFGMEHLMREIGQIYEATINSTHKQQQRFSILPVIAAKLIIRGQPFEILDGDASGVPVTWVNAVFTELERLTGNKDVYCLSVLGIQSTGKSTLLNTMFGHQSSVSAGRCTRGVYMQLVTVAKNSSFPFDYIAVFDSEGLRAPEVGESKVDHDNELATFVIGLGNLTLLNIKGENVAEIKDILQIVSHAFLRMKLVNKSIQDDRSCIFIHQNVAAVNAKEMMAHGAQELEKALDMKTKEAAELENMIGICSFDQIIKFDNQKDVWYFPDLWTGDPPMAYVNTGYQENVTALKSSILNQYAMESKSVFRLSVIKDHIQDMWHGVLVDDFVFGFRNSAVTKAYKNLERKFSELKWDMEKSALAWIDNIPWEKCVTQQELQLYSIKLKKGITDLIYAKLTDLSSQLDKFIDTDSQKTIMLPWKNDKKVALKYAAETQCSKSKDAIDLKQKVQFVNLLQSNRQDCHKLDILKKAERLAEDLIGQSLRMESELQIEFENMWDDWIGNINTNESNPINIYAELYHILHEHFPGHRFFLEDMLKNDHHMRKLKYAKLLDSFKASDIQDEDLSFSKKWLNMKNRSTYEKGVAKESVAKLLQAIFAQINSLLAGYRKRKTGFQNHDAKLLINTIVEQMTTFDQNDPQKGYSIKVEFHVKVTVHVCRYLLHVFETQQREYEKNWSPAAQLNAYKQTSLNFFMNVVTRKSKETIVVDMVCDQIEDMLKKQVQKKLHLEVVEEIVPHFLTKRKLIKVMLEEMAEKENFTSYKAYIFNPKSFATDWVTKYTDKFIFDERQNSCWYVDHSKKHITDLLRNVEKAIEKACTSRSQQTTRTWIKTFIQEVSGTIPLTENDFQHISQYGIEDFRTLKQPLYKRIKKVKDSVIASFEEYNVASITWSDPTPYIQILDAIWGCPAICLFCKEPCIKADINHVSKTDPHECLQHRPQAVSRGHYFGSNVLTLGNCNFLVQSSEGFYCGGKYTCLCKNKHTEEILHHYSEIKNLIPMWKIAPSNDMDSSIYWMWFLSKFQDQLIVGTAYKSAKIPDSWNNITKKKAIESLFFYD